MKNVCANFYKILVFCGLIHIIIKHIHVGANCPRTPGTILHLEALSWVPSRNHNLPELSQIFKDPQIGLGSQASWKVTWF